MTTEMGLKTLFRLKSSKNTYFNMRMPKTNFISKGNKIDIKR